MKMFHACIALRAVMLIHWSAAHAATPAQQAYLKASNPGVSDAFGYSVAISGDTMVVGAAFERSNSSGVNGNQDDDSLERSGAAYVFVRNGTNWIQQAYLKAFNPQSFAYFGISVSVSGDTLVVGAFRESSNAVGVNGSPTTNSASDSIGAAYVFVRNGTNWTQQAYLKASNADSHDDTFGYSVSMSGETILVGAPGEWSGATGVNGDQNDNSVPLAGAVYSFVRSGTNWIQQAYLKASNNRLTEHTTGYRFGWSVSLSGDIAVIGSPDEESNAVGVDGNQDDHSLQSAGAAYVFQRNGTNWAQQAYLKASHIGVSDHFGYSVAASADTVAVWSPFEDHCGVAHIFARTGTNWIQQAALKASLAYLDIPYAGQVALAGDTLVIGKHRDYSAGGEAAGAAYVYSRCGTNWSTATILRGANTGTYDWFGFSVAVSGDTMVAGSAAENGGATYSGAAYVFTGVGIRPTLKLEPDGSGGYFLRCDGHAGFIYQLERAPTVTGPWTTNATITAAASGLLEFHDTNAPAGQAFYRVAQP